MGRSITRALAAAVAAGLTLSTAGFAGATSGGNGPSRALWSARLRSAAAESPAAGVPGEQLWVARYDHGDSDAAASAAISPDGTSLFVTGSSISGPDHEPEYATVAYSTATGARLWARRWAQVAVGERSAVARAVAVSPDGTRVLVTGSSARRTGTGSDYATLAYRS
jgi:hypothetical protein